MLTHQLIRTHQRHLSNNKADRCHSMGVSFNNCMLRIPGSVNSKVSKQVTVIQQWNGIKPSIKPLLYDFYIHLVSTKLKVVQGINLKREVATRRYHSYWNSQ